MEVASIVLAGGKGLRLGKAKALEIAGGKSLIERVVQRLKQLSSHVLIATSKEQLDLLAAIDAEILVDIYPDKGPLGGMYTGLMASPFLHNVVVACDMPFLNIELVRYMVELSRDFDACVPRLSMGRLEPLHAVYSKACLDNIRTQLDSGQLGAYSFLNKLCVRYIERSECQRFDPRLLSFFNINHQSDLDWAITLATDQVP